MTVYFALIRKSPESPEVYLVSGRCDPSVVTTIYKHCSTLSVRAHGTFPPRCWHKEVLSTTPATFTLQISAKIHCVVSSKTRDDVFTVVVMVVMKLCVNVILLPDPRPKASSPLVMLSDWTSLCARMSPGSSSHISASLDPGNTQSSDNTMLHKMMINMGSSNNGIPISADTIITTLTLVSSFHPVSSVQCLEAGGESGNMSQDPRETGMSLMRRRQRRIIQTPCSSLFWNYKST